MSMQDVENFIDNLAMLSDVFFFCFPFFFLYVYRHVVHVDSHLFCCDQVSEQGIHHGLEGCWRVGQTKEHYSWFKESFVHGEHCLPFVPFFYSHCIVPPFDVKFGEQCAVLQAINKLGYEQEQIAVLDSPFINRSVVLYQLKFPISLFDEEEGSCIGAFGWADGSPLLMFFQELLEFHLFWLRQSDVSADQHQRCSRFEVDSVSPWLGRWEFL